MFSLGSVLYTMCTGRPPFRAETAVAMLRRVTDDEPRSICEVNADSPDWLEAITFKLLAKDPAERFQSAAEVADLLSQHLAHLQHPTTAPLPPRIAQPKPASPLREQRLIADQSRGSTWRRRLWPAMGIGALTLMFGFLLLGAIIHVVTDRGELIIEVDDPQIQVQITQGGREVKILKEGDYRITMLRSGHYNIEVLGENSDSFEISDERLDISRGIKKVVTIRRKPSQEVGQLVEQLTEVRTFKGHTQFVRQVAFFHDGRRAVSTSTDTTLRIWEIETGRQLKAINTGKPLDGLAVSPDDKLVAVGVDEAPYVVELWNIESGEKVGTLRGHTARVVEVAFTPDGKRLMTSGYDWMVRIWDVESRHIVHQFATSQPAAAALSPDGELVVTRKTDDRHIIRLWKTSGEVAGDFRTTEGLLLRSAFSSDSKRLAAVARGRVHVWDVANGKELLQINAHPGPVLDVWYTPDDRHLLTTGENDLTLRVWDAATGNLVAVTMANTWRFNNVAVSPDGSYVIAGGGANWNPKEDRWDTDGDFGVHLYRLPESVVSTESSSIEEITEVRRLEGHTDIVNTLTFSRDGRSMFSGSQKLLFHWDLATGKVIRKIPVESPIKGAAALPTGDHVVTSHFDGEIKLWNLNNGRVVRDFAGHTKMVYSLSVSADGKRLLSGDHDGLVRLWDVDSGDPIHSFQESYCGAVAISSDGRFGAHGAGGILMIWNADTGGTMHRIERGPSSVNSLAFSPNGDYLVSGRYYGAVDVWEVATGKPIYHIDAHRDVVTSLCFMPDGRHFLSGSFDKTIRLFELATGREIAHAECDNHYATNLAIAPDGHTLASGGGYWLELKDRAKWQFIQRYDREFPICLWRLPTPTAQPKTAVSLGIKLRLIPAGEFEMGTAGEDAETLPVNDEWFFADFVSDRREAETPRHKVTISKQFEMSEHEVTVGQFRQFVAATGYKSTAEQEGEGYGWRNGEWQEGAAFNWQNPGFEQTDDHPVCNVSWDDATEFCRWLSEQEGVTDRLPTEAEWEYACRAGTTTLFTTGDDPFTLQGAANLADRALRTEQPSVAWAVDWDDGFPATAPVGSFRPNAFGLQDMHGNVWEWCQDVYDDEWYETSPATDPVRRGSGRHVFRGGGFDNWPGFLRSSDRYSSHSESIFTDWAGFRVVREVEAARP